MEKSNKKETIKKSKKKEKKIYDTNASISASIFRFIVSFAVLGITIVLLFNTWNLSVGSFNTYHNVKNNTMETYAKEFYSKESLYTDTKLIDNKQALSDLKKTDAKTYMYYTIYEMVVLEVDLILVFLLLNYLLDFLSVKNLNNVFSSESIERVNKIIKYSLFTIIIPIVLSCIGQIIALISKKTYPNIGNNFPTEYLFLLFLFYIIRYIINTAREQMN